MKSKLYLHKLGRLVSLQREMINQVDWIDAWLIAERKPIINQSLTNVLANLMRRDCLIG